MLFSIINLFFFLQYSAIIKLLPSNTAMKTSENCDFQIFAKILFAFKHMFKPIYGPLISYAKRFFCSKA